MRWPVNDEPLNTFRPLELLFPISKKEFVLVLFQFPTMIVLNFLLDSLLNRRFATATVGSCGPYWNCHGTERAMTFGALIWV